MQATDLINAAFEVFGSFATWGTFLAIRKDRGYAGIRLPIMAFFTSWGFWNLYFYSHLLQWFSLFASLSLTAGNVAIIAAMLYYGRKYERTENVRESAGPGIHPDSNYRQGACCDDNGPRSTAVDYSGSVLCSEGKRCSLDICGLRHPTS